MKASPAVSTSPEKLSPVSTLLKNSWQIYQSHIKVFSAIMLFPFIFTLIVYFIYASGVLVRAHAFWPFWVIAFLTLVNAFLQLLVYPALICCAKENLALTDSLKGGVRKFLPFFTVALLASLIGIIGFGLLVIPGIIVTVWFSLAAYILIFEEQKGMAALMRSKELVRGYFFPVLLRLLAAGAIVAVIAVLIPFLISLAVKVEAVNFSLNNLMDIFATPFLVVFGIQIYHDLKRLNSE